MAESKPQQSSWHDMLSVIVYHKLEIMQQEISTYKRLFHLIQILHHDQFVRHDLAFGLQIENLVGLKSALECLIFPGFREFSKSSR